ncbi:MAG: ArgE/DapE family deacylase [Caldilineaceae bacterium]|nr:ArgE/DapE family deacylase [Caldilineaceae bacterium]
MWNSGPQTADGGRQVTDRGPIPSPQSPVTSVDDSLESKIAGAVKDLAPVMIGFLQRMVQTPSLPNAEAAVQGIIADQLRTLRIAVEIVPTRFAELADHPAFGDDGFSPDQRINVVGIWPGDLSLGGGQGSLILNGHVDVVSAGDESLWSVPPWSGAIVEGKLYGRGSCDMKAGLAAGILAVAALRQLGYQPAHNICFQSVIGEESGGVGALTTIVKGYRADGVIVLEPTRQELCPLQSGALTFRLTVRGKAAHAAMKIEGISAIAKFGLLYEAIERLDRERHERYANPFFENPVNVAPINIGTVRGGEWHSTVAETVVAEGRCGVFPGESAADARRLLAETIRMVAERDPWLRQHPPQLEWFEGQFESAQTTVDHPLIRTLAAQHRRIHGAEPTIRGVPYGSDMRLFINHGGMPAVHYGPGDVRLAHAVNEYVEIDEVVAVAKTLALMIVEWCGGVTKVVRSA